MNQSRPIGVFDSGIGGLSVLAALRAEMPAERFVYLADSGNAPYGERDDAFVIERTFTIAQYLSTVHNVKALVVACNTATAAAIGLLRQAMPALAIVGVEPALKPALAHTRTGRVGVIGTRTTLGSAKFRALHQSLEAQADFVIQPCDGLARAIEEAGTQSQSPQNATEIRALCTDYTAAMGVFGTQFGAIDTLVLGCTHYVFAAPLLRALVGPDVGLIDTGLPVARQTRRLLAAANALAADEIKTTMGTSDRLSTAGGSHSSTGSADRLLKKGWSDHSAGQRDKQIGMRAHSTQFITTGNPDRLQAAAQRWLQIKQAVFTVADVNAITSVTPISAILTVSASSDFST